MVVATSADDVVRAKREGQVDLEDVTKYPALAEALLTAGFDSRGVVKIMGGNVFRVFGEVLRSCLPRQLRKHWPIGNKSGQPPQEEL